MPREQSAAGIRDGSRDHNGQIDTRLRKAALYSKNRRLCIQYVKDGFNKNDLHFALNQTPRGDCVIIYQLVKGNIPVTWIINIRGEAGGFSRRANCAGNETQLVVFL